MDSHVIKILIQCLTLKARIFFEPQVYTYSSSKEQKIRDLRAL